MGRHKKIVEPPKPDLIELPISEGIAKKMTGKGIIKTKFPESVVEEKELIYEAQIGYQVAKRLGITENPNTVVDAEVEKFLARSERARMKLIDMHQDLVYKLLKKQTSNLKLSKDDWEDLKMVAICSLDAHVLKYDFNYLNRFSTFAYYEITDDIATYVKKTFFNSSRSADYNRNAVLKYIEKYKTENNGMDPDLETIVKNVEFVSSTHKTEEGKRKYIQTLLDSKDGGTISLQKEIGEDITLADTLADDGEQSFNEQIKNETVDLILKAYDKYLIKIERTLFRKILYKDENDTKEEILNRFAKFLAKDYNKKPDSELSDTEQRKKRLQNKIRDLSLNQPDILELFNILKECINNDN